MICLHFSQVKSNVKTKEIKKNVNNFIWYNKYLISSTNQSYQNIDNLVD